MTYRRPSTRTNGRVLATREKRSRSLEGLSKTLSSTLHMILSSFAQNIKRLGLTFPTRHAETGKYFKLDDFIVNWDDIAPSATSALDTMDDSPQYVMRSDMCRRFTFGFTIENTEMWIWFCCCSMVVGKECVQDYTSLVTFVLAVPSARRVEPGWDLTVDVSTMAASAYYELPFNPLSGIKSKWWITVWTTTCNGIMGDKWAVEYVEDTGSIFSKLHDPPIDWTLWKKAITDTFPLSLEVVSRSLSDMPPPPSPDNLRGTTEDA
ncbi:hypothetical protein PILCRDRAFT_6867 [Piloderma croceum F 1598]|uniref:Fungal-type protein kinase domain-containing protein n=1 Tax=Piloderma croceum (strain F 1598) TaxID=765440 RepID=A0A0C3BCI2_PILCF|nr:hypothetical protein PILCRDRAFT_6867 [Piloderma croceum F 1598]